jgi:hypothetical protein
MLCITFPKIEFAEQQSLVQKAREERLEYIVSDCVKMLENGRFENAGCAG